MKKLNIIQFGDNAQGVRLRGNSAQPEPEYVLVKLPGGEVEVARCTDGSYWIHFRVNKPTDSEVVEGDSVAGKLLSARADIVGAPGPEDLHRPGLEHIAIRVAVDSR